jgi:uncharacterized protein (DUF885 family)
VRFFVEVNGSNPLEVASEVDHSRFDLKAFDDAVVLGGNVPLDVLGMNVDAYIRGE